MKKAKNTIQNQYYLEIRDLQHQPIFAIEGVSLREAVRLAGKHVLLMENYQKVYREAMNLHGFYSRAYLAYAVREPGFRRVTVTIATIELPSTENFQLLLEEAKAHIKTTKIERLLKGL
jgi:hypothetical protein